MLLDAEHEFSDSQALTATAVGTNTIDLTIDRSIGNGEPMAVLFVVEVAADQTTGDEDYTFEVEYASAADQSAGQKSVGRVIFESGAPTAPANNADLLVAGYNFTVAIPPRTLDTSERYLGVRYTLEGTSPSVTVSAYLQPMSMIDSQSDVHYAAGYSFA